MRKVFFFFLSLPLVESAFVMNHALDQIKYLDLVWAHTQDAAVITAPTSPSVAATCCFLSEDTTVRPLNQPLKWVLFSALLQYDKPLSHSSEFADGTSWHPSVWGIVCGRWSRTYYHSTLHNKVLFFLTNCMLWCFMSQSLFLFWI